MPYNTPDGIFEDYEPEERQDNSDDTMRTLEQQIQEDEDRYGWEVCY